ncbi:hypothetical protein D5S12_15120 [Pseudomonas syringae]|nr:hypothetical protein D5S12_15120 [Pseudomonas syringae]
MNDSTPQSKMFDRCCWPNSGALTAHPAQTQVFQGRRAAGMADNAVRLASQRSCHCWLINKKNSDS